MGSVQCQIIAWSGLYLLSKSTIAPQVQSQLNCRILICCTCHFQDGYLFFSLLRLASSACKSFQCLISTQDGWVMVESSDRIWPTGEGNGKPLQYFCLEIPMNSMKWQNDRILKRELPGSVGAQYATGDQWRNNSRKNEGMEPKQKEYPAVDVTGDRSKGQCCK